MPQDEGCSESRCDRSNSQSISQGNSQCRARGQPGNSPMRHTLKSLVSRSIDARRAADRPSSFYPYGLHCGDRPTHQRFLEVLFFRPFVLVGEMA